MPVISKIEYRNGKIVAPTDVRATSARLSDDLDTGRSNGMAGLPTDAVGYVHVFQVRESALTIEDAEHRFDATRRQFYAMYRPKYGFKVLREEQPKYGTLGTGGVVVSANIIYAIETNPKSRY